MKYFTCKGCQVSVKVSVVGYYKDKRSVTRLRSNNMISYKTYTHGIKS